ncbi:hypothetical protein [Reichenbachiella ulvae]|uniref:LVIVD repeat-containing protein n=1 Tax=Reichenbachiella ulvae TaxID=2980104 RepID=A0ABT3CQZ1_9BACT|nr:hypothetical protein [Reichenbachiella ulvae]MCV9385890.1 hypothetical protein [Reichenbachiella ulvae]
MKRLFIFAIALTLLLTNCEDSGLDGFGFDSGVSEGGSIARFHITNTHLYVIDQDELMAFDITDFENVREVYSDYYGWEGSELETIYRYDQTLFVGTQTGVLIFDISSPDRPEYVSVYRHVTACDPVVTDGQVAYSTLRSGGICGGAEDILDIIDVSNLSDPKQMKSINMTSPYGLVLFDDWLYVGEGENGMKVFDVSTPSEAVEILSYSDIKARDFIRDGQNLIINTEDGLVQATVGSDGSLSVISQLNYN